MKTLFNLVKFCYIIKCAQIYYTIRGILMSNGIAKYTRLMIGLFVCAFSIVMNVNSGIGVSPWEVLSTGVANVTGLSIGRAAIAISITVVAIDYMLGIKIGLGTLLNMIFVGIFTDLVIWMNIIPKPTSLPMQWTLLLAGLMVFNIGVMLYIGAGLGAGPRDGLMLGISKKLNKPISIVKTGIEVGVTVIGILLGGYFGLGTIFIALVGGALMGATYKVIKFDIKGVEHKFLNHYFTRPKEAQEVE